MTAHAQLRTVLRANATFAAITGIAAVAATGPIAGWIGVGEHRFISAMGAGLVVFAGAVLLVSAQPVPTLRRWARLVSTADLGWVLGTAAVIAFAGLSVQGDVILAGLAAVVGTFAFLQLWGANAITAEEDSAQVIEIARTLAGSAETIWAAVIDHETYGRIAPNLSKVEATGPNGPDLTRRCWDTRGRHWDEACVAWDEGQSFAVEVDTAADEYPYPLQGLRGSWTVEPIDATHARVTVRFELRPNPGPAGAAFALAMTAAARPLVRRITNAWQDIANRHQEAV